MLFEEFEKLTQNLISFIHWIITYQNAKKKNPKKQKVTYFRSELPLKTFSLKLTTYIN